MSDHSSDTQSRYGPELIARDGRALFGSAGLAVSGQCAAFAAGLGCTILTARLLGKTGYGRLAMFFMVMAVLSQVLISWPHLGLVRFGREELAHTGKIGAAFAAAFALFLFNLLLAGVLIRVFLEPLHEYLGIRFAAPPLVFAYLFGYLGLNQAIFFCRAVFQTVNNFRAYAWTTFSVRFLNLVFILIAFVVLAWPAGVAPILRAHLLSLAIVLLMCLWLLPWGRLANLRLCAAVVKKIVSYAWPLMLGGTWILVVDWVDLVLIKHLGTEAEVGAYAIAYQPVTVLTQIRIAFVSALMPLLVSLAVEKRHQALAWALDEALPQFAWVAGAGATVAAGLAEAIPLLFGADYTVSVLPCRILMVGVAFAAVAALHAAVARALDHVAVTVVILFVLAALNIILDLVLFPRMRIAGPAVATAAAFAVSGFIYFPFFNRLRPLRGKKTPNRRYGALLALAPPVIFAAAASCLGRPAHRLAACAVVLLVAALAARAAGIFNQASLDTLESMRMPAAARAGVRAFYRLMGNRR